MRDFASSVDLLSVPEQQGKSDAEAERGRLRATVSLIKVSMVSVD